MTVLLTTRRIVPAERRGNSRWKGERASDEAALITAIGLTKRRDLRISITGAQSGTNVIIHDDAKLLVITDSWPNCGTLIIHFCPDFDEHKPNITC